MQLDRAVEIRIISAVEFKIIGILFPDSSIGRASGC